MFVRRGHRSFNVLSVVTLLTVGSVAKSEIGTDIGLGYSDNLVRVAEPVQSERILVARLGGQAQSTAASLEGDVRWELGAIEYIDGAYSDEPLVFLDGSAEFRLIERRVSWLLQDRVDRQSLDPFSPVTAESREYVNFFVTGPEFRFPVATHIAAELDLTYTDTWYEQRFLDNSGPAGRIGLRFAGGARQSFGVFGTVQKINFDNPLLYDDYRRQQFFLQYESARRRGNIRVAIGESEIRRDEQRRDSPMLEMDWSRRISAYGNLAVELRRGLSHTSDSAQIGRAEELDPGYAEYIADFGDPYELTYVSTQLGLAKPRTSVAIAYRQQDQEYENLPGLDRDLASLEIILIRNLSRRMAMNIAAFATRQEFVQSGQQDDDRRATIGLAWRFGRRAEFSVRLASFDRSSTAVGNSYRENRAFLSFSYGATLSGLQASL